MSLKFLGGSWSVTKISISEIVQIICGAVLKSLESEEFKLYLVVKFDALMTEILLVKDLECPVSDCLDCEVSP